MQPDMIGKNLSHNESRKAVRVLRPTKNCTM